MINNQHITKIVFYFDFSKRQCDYFLRSAMFLTFYQYKRDGRQKNSLISGSGKVSI